MVNLKKRTRSAHTYALLFEHAYITPTFPMYFDHAFYTEAIENDDRGLNGEQGWKAVVRTFASHQCKLLLLLLGSISAASSGPVFLPDRGIISRTAAGNRAYSVARLLSVVLSKTSS